MKHILKEKINEAVMSVVPLTIVVIIIDLLICFASGRSVPVGMVLQFVIGSVFVLFGLFFLALGEDLAMIYMGDRIGAHLARTNKYVLLIICSLLLGALITFAEPNLAIFAELLPGIESRRIIIFTALGVGIFLVIAVIRVIKRIPLPISLTVVYAIVFALAYFAPNSIIAVAFDSGGVATGPITASFILAVGIGLASVRGGRSSVDDSFGSVAFCTVGPVAAMLILGMIFGTGNVSLESVHAREAVGAEIILDYLEELPKILEEVGLALLPIIIFFTVFQFVFLKLRRQRLIRSGLGIVYAFLGHTLLLTGVYVGFFPTGLYLGELTASLPNNLYLLIIPVGMLFGGLIVHAEPAIHVLIEQAEEVTVGAVTKKAMLTMIVVGVVIAVGISMLRIVLDIPIWYFLLAGYIFSLILSFIVPKVFTAIAFDSGAASSGAMTVAFLLPFAKGAGQVLSEDGSGVIMNAFGLIALVVIMPIITIQILGLGYKLMMKRVSPVISGGDDTVTIIEFGGENA